MYILMQIVAESKDIALWKMILSDAVIPLLVMFISPFVIMLSRRLIDMLQSYLNVEISEKRQKQMDQVILDAISYVEEQARKGVKGEKTFQDVFNASKMEVAINYTRKRAKELEMDEFFSETSEAITEKIEAKLFKERKSSGKELESNKDDNFSNRLEVQINRLEEISEDISEDFEGFDAFKKTHLNDKGEG